MPVAELVLLAWTGVVFWALGQIWFAQIVVYPLFAQVGEAEYVAYHRFYVRRIPAPVIVPGFACFLLPVAVAALGPAVPAWTSVANLAAAAVGLLVTVVLEIPRHNRLERARDATTIAELIRYNWPRTASITVQAVATLAMWHAVLARGG